MLSVRLDAALLKKQRHFSTPQHEQLPLPAEKAIELVKASVDTGDSPGHKNVLRLELLSHEGFDATDRGSRIYYYLIEMIAGGSEVHRVVLMDGTVVKSSLRELKKP